jgi:hypothetical protein
MMRLIQIKPDWPDHLKTRGKAIAQHCLVLEISAQLMPPTLSWSAQ